MLTDFWAKNDGLPLFTHLQQVANLAVKLAALSKLESKTAFYAGILHDIGKAHPTFQQRVKQKNAYDSIDLNTSIFRHEISSLAFISLFPTDLQSDIIEMVVGHHKGYNQAKTGLSSLLNEEGPDALIKKHLKNWGEWSKSALEMLFALAPDLQGEISEEQAGENLIFAFEVAKKINLEKGWSEARGLLIAADHMASAIANDEAIARFEIAPPPNLHFFQRQSELYPLSMVETDISKMHTLVIAPTGAGKTDFLMKQTQGRVFYMLPFMASIDAMYLRFKQADLKTEIRKLHSKSRHIEQDTKNPDAEMEVLFQAFAGAGVKVLTPHQVGETAIGSNGYEAQLIDLQACDIILDEIHTYSNANQAMVWGICRTLRKLNCRLHIGSATMPSKLVDKLMEELGGEQNLNFIKLKEEELDSYNRHIVHKLQEEEEIYTIINQHLEKNEKVLIVVNTVKKSQELFLEIKELYAQKVPIMLIHSRFKRADRAEKERLLREQYNEPSTGACIVISTQVVEVSLDISFDCLISECAPIDSLVQRFGRVNRRRLPKEERTLKPVYILSPTDSKGPYKKEILEKTFEVLPNAEVLQESLLQALIDEVYPSPEFASWESALAVNPNQEWGLRKLENNANKLSQLLQIEGDVAILFDDKAAYENPKTHFSVREALEIPVPASFKWGAGKALLRSPIANRPFIIPQTLENYQELGLYIENPPQDNIL